MTPSAIRTQDLGPYRKDATWRNFFDRLAEAIASEVSPRTALDAGCRHGYLVAGLRRRGIEAWGIDTAQENPSAIDDDARPYCAPGALSKPFPQDYDLVTLIEVIPGAEDNQTVIENACRHARNVLFVARTRQDSGSETEPTPGILAAFDWSVCFARQGFIRDLDIEAKLPYPDAMIFRHSDAPVIEAVAAYERRLSRLEIELAEARAKQQSLVTALAASEDARMEIDRLVAERGRALREIEAGRPYRMALKMRSLRRSLAPVDSAQSRRMIQTIETLREWSKRLDPRRSGFPSGYPAEYRSWILRAEPSPAQIQRQRRHSFKEAPLLSLLMPLDGAHIDLLTTTLHSLFRQTYANWEVLPVCKTTQGQALLNALQESNASDPRIRAGMDTNWIQIPPAGDYVAWIDPGDQLPDFALFTAAQALIDEPQIDLLYSDEDRLTPDGRLRHGHFFKPDWSPDLLRSCNYIHRLALVRKSALQQAWLLDETASGEYDVYLRIAESGGKVRHLPQVLYHNRSAAAPGDPTPIWEEKRSPTDQPALEAHLHRIGLDAKVDEGRIPGSYQFRLPAVPARVSILIPNQDQAAALERCVGSILEKTVHAELEILIIENNSIEDKTHALYASLGRQDGRVSVISYPEKFNFAQINNQAAHASTGEYLLFLNNDTEVISPDWIERLLDFARIPQTGAVGAMLYYPNDTIQHGGVIVGMWGSAAHSHKYLPRGAAGYNGRAAVAQNLSAVTAACCLLRRELFFQIGGFDEKYPVAYNDLDLCLRLQEAGYRIVWTPFAELYHHEQLTRGSDRSAGARDRSMIETDRIQTRWPGIFKNGDPFFTPNLTLDEDYSLHLAGSLRQ